MLKKICRQDAGKGAIKRYVRCCSHLLAVPDSSELSPVGRYNASQPMLEAVSELAVP